MTIAKPYHSERRTIWYVHDGDTCVATLEIGQYYRSDVGNLYRLRDVTWHTGYVTVERMVGNNPDSVHTWRIESLVNSHMTLE